MFDHVREPAFRGDLPVAADPDALPDRRELALVAVERTRMPMVVSDPRKPDNPIVLANRAFLDLTGYSADEVLGRNCRFLQGPATDPASIDAIRRGLAEGDEHFTVELLNYRKDGTAFWNQLSISPVHDATGELIYHFASQKDVSARRRAQALEEAERLLLMEVDHRALNALAIVKSIVSLTRAETIEGYAGAVRARVDALARAHRLLAASGWTVAPFADLVAAEVPAGVAARVEVEGPPAQLRAQLVQPVMLVLHELITNAVEHGALSREEGRLTIRWNYRPNRILVQWRELGGPSPQPSPAPGFGLSIAEGVIVRQLRGRLEMVWASDGLQATIAIPLVSADNPG